MPQIPSRFNISRQIPTTAVPPQLLHSLAEDQATEQAVADEAVLGFDGLLHEDLQIAEPKKRSIRAAAVAAASATGSQAAAVLSPTAGKNPLVPKLSITDWHISPDNIARAMGLTQ